MSMFDENPPTARNMRLWMPAIILALLAAVVAYLHFGTDLDDGSRFGYSMMLSILAVPLLAAWFIFFTGLDWSARLILLVAAVGVAVLFFKMVRVDGMSGDMRPRLVWRWTPPRDAGLPDLPESTDPDARAKVDVTVWTQDFPQFGGSQGDLEIRYASLARDWTTYKPTEIWRVPVGLGWGGFAVAGSLAVTQEQRGEKELTVARDRATGQVLWSHAHDARFSEAMGGDGPRATPTIAPGRVYAMGATGILDCLDAATGRCLWTRDVLADSGGRNLVWGKSCSPLIYKKLVIVTAGEAKKAQPLPSPSEGRPPLPSLVAYDRDTGKPAWSHGWDLPSYGTPQVIRLGGEEQIVIVNARSVTGHDPDDGTMRWEFLWPNEMAKASQVVTLAEDRLLLTCGYASADAPTTVLLKLSRQDKRWNAEKIWGNNRLKTKFTTAVAREGYAYGLDDGTLACLDLSTGERVWKAGRYGHGQILLADDLLLVQMETGPVALVEATPDGHHERGRIDALVGKTWNNLALAGRHLFARNDREAVCYELPREK